MPRFIDQESVSGILWHEAALILLRVDQAGTVIECNPFALRLTGKNLAGMPLGEIFGSAALDVAALVADPQPSARILPTQAGIPVNAMFRFVAADSAQVIAVGWIEVLELLRLQQALIDINSKMSDIARANFKDSRFDLDQQAETQRRILEAAAEGICGLDGKGRCSFANSAAASMLGYASSDELIRQSSRETLRSRDTAIRRSSP